LRHHIAKHLIESLFDFVQNGNNAKQTKEVSDKAMAFTQFKRKVNLQ